MARGIVRWALLGIALQVLGACALLELGEQSKSFYQSSVLVGRVEGPPGWRGPVIVAAYELGARPLNIVHQTLLHEPGGYELIVPRGRYGLFAFGDTNGNGRFDAGEPAAEYRGSEPIVATGTGVLLSLDLVLAAQAGRPSAVPQGTEFIAAGRSGHSTQAGALANLDSAIFAPESGQRGYWAPMDFFREIGGNIYFLEPYDPTRIPVLFVHGAGGTPRDWRYIAEHLDRTRYQAWFFYYPSGASLDSMAYLLYWKLFNLRLRYHYETLYLSAHSMGGLVVRTFLLNHGGDIAQAKLFVSMSTPWAGEPAAALGVRYSPAVIPSWIDMQPGGRFMRALFARRLPPGVAYYLLFGHRGGYNLLRPNNDGTVTLASQLRDSAQAEARRVFGFDEDHVSILSSPRVMSQFQSILASADKRAGADPDSGRLQVTFHYPEAATGPTGLPILLLTPAGTHEAERDRISIPMRPQDSGAAVGPIPPGDYDVALVADAYRSEPRRQRVRLEPNTAPALSFELTAQGALNGYIGADGSAETFPAGSYRPPHPGLTIDSIRLSGPGVDRRPSPRPVGSGEIVEHYLAGEDAVVGAHFSFVDLPAGEYELHINAHGYRPYSARHVIVPGRPALITPIVLEPVRKN